MDINKYFPDGYPLTIERLQFVQDALLKGVSQLTKIAGSGNLIIEGVINSGGNLSAGTIVIDGEIIDFEASPLTSEIRIFETETNVPYNIDADGDGNLDEKPADTVRVARSATSGGVKTVSYSSFSRVGQLTGAQLPIGSIIPFVGNVNDIPQGWELYDLRNKFLMGAGGTHSAGATGGENSVTLTTAQMPRHRHTGTTTTNGAHSHTYERSQRGRGFDTKRDDTAHQENYNQTTSTAGSHNHTVTTDYQGSGLAHENRPEFLAVNFIRRVSI